MSHNYITDMFLLSIFKKYISCSTQFLNRFRYGIGGVVNPQKFEVQEWSGKKITAT